jgi:hypothetical protein
MPARITLPARGAARFAITMGFGLALAACGGQRPGPAYGGEAPGPGRAEPGSTAVAESAGGRGMGVEPLTLELSPSVRGSRPGPLADGAILRSGDRISIEAATSSAAHVYLVFCDSRRRLTRYPPAGSIPTPGGQATSLLGSSALVLDDNPGREALYVIASQWPLDQADPQLDQALVRARPDDPSADCGERFEAVLAGGQATTPDAQAKLPPDALTHVVGGAAPLPAAPTAPPKTQAPGGSAARPTALPRPRQAGPDPEQECPTIETVRKPSADGASICGAGRSRATLLRGLHVESPSGAGVKAASRGDGIVVLRFGFSHQPKPLPPPGDGQGRLQRTTLGTPSAGPERP